MVKFFKKNKKSKDQKRHSGQNKDRRPKKTSDKDLVDPIFYNGELNVEKYPILPTQAEKKEEEEIENPLNKR